MRFSRPVAAVSGLLLLALLPAAAGHGPVNARELETLIVKDELSDVVTSLELGYDLGELYVGEAFLPGLGDGLYIHTILFGGSGDRPAVDGPLGVRYTFTMDQAEVVRTMSTEDGAEFSSDFDRLEVEVGDGEVEVQRAFLVYPAGMGPGTVLKTLKAESLVGGETRDIAPGGYMSPAGSEVPLGDPGDSAQVVDSYTLKGPVGYVEANVRAAGEAFELEARNPLKEGDQHILLLLPDDMDGWTVQASDGGEVKAGQTKVFSLKLTPGSGSGPLAFDVITDIGGRLPLQAVQDGDQVILSSPDGDASVGQASVQESPSPLWLAPLALAAALLLARKAQR